jgi:hypothetical protein
MSTRLRRVGVLLVVMAFLLLPAQKVSADNCGALLIACLDEGGNPDWCCVGYCVCTGGGNWTVCWAACGFPIMP